MTKSPSKSSPEYNNEIEKSKLMDDE